METNTREGIEESIRHFCNAFAMTMPPSNEMMQATRNLRNQLPSFIHQELQKAREERDAQWRKHLETCKIEVDFVDGKPRAKIDPLPQSELDQPIS